MIFWELCGAMLFPFLLPDHSLLINNTWECGFAMIYLLHIEEVFSPKRSCHNKYLNSECGPVLFVHFLNKLSI